MQMKMKVKILDTKHAGVMPEDEGTVVEAFTDGYAVRLSIRKVANFGGATYRKNAIVFCKKEEVEIIKDNEYSKSQQVTPTKAYAIADQPLPASHPAHRRT